jgi:putative membrane protein insertion efficiency factor
MNMQPLLTIPARFAIGCIRQYKRLISPLLGDVCRFYPSCADYAMAVFESHGLNRGGWLALKRLSRCHPYSAGGIDEPPVSPR